MTYNFDAERWFELQRQRLLAQRAAGALDEQGLAAALERLEAQLEALQARLDGSFQVGPLAPRGER
ncbi:MAG TPA: hypothetical protein P5234_03545 [Thermoanaerobaculaceae bacterium]|nr:hypothetical protein [Thermoanaerobaculaceae bacterium]HRS15306.1 hypothetical protein [Thermoanaerobaculaceae bacterium]